MQKFIYTLCLFLITNISFSQDITFEWGGILIDHPQDDAGFGYPMVPMDYNSDGLTDMIGHSFSDIFLYKGNGGTPAFEQLGINENLSGKVLKVIDFDNDGNQDVITDRAILLNDSNDEFLSIEQTSGGITIVEVADFNNDGFNDYLSVEEITFSPDVLKVHFNNGNNTFNAMSIYDKYDYGDIDFGDIDNDGDLDLVVALDFEEYSFVILTNEGNSFTEKIVPFSFDIGPSIYLRDIDNDDDLDIVTCGTNKDIITIRNVDNFTSNAGMNMIELPDVLFFTMADLNGDGYDDIFAVEHSELNPTIQVMEGGFFPIFKDLVKVTSLGFANNIGAPNYNYLAANVSLYDYDSDGKKDIVFVDGFGTQSTVKWVRNITSFSPSNIDFKLETIYTVFPNPVKNLLTITTKQGTDRLSNYAYEIFSVDGRRVMFGAANSKSIDVSSLDAGSYFLKSAKLGMLEKFIKL